MAVSQEEIQQYLQETRYIELATVNEKQAPSLCTPGGFAPHRRNVYFSTGAATNKVEHIETKRHVKKTLAQASAALCHHAMFHV